MTGAAAELYAGAHGAANGGSADGGSEPELRVTTLELFFDLIFAFTLTQLAALLAPRLTIERVVQVLLIFGLLWWMYGGYAWLTNTRAPTRTPERLLLLLGMAGFLIVGLAIPHGFGRDGIALGLGYLLVVVVHSGLYARVNRHIWRIAPFNLASALLVIAAGIFGGPAEYGLWVAALAIQAGAPLVVRLGGRFEIRPAHFAERHGALVIVAIGESVAAIGIGAAGLGVRASLVLAAVLGLALAATLWWMYFGSGDDERGERAMRAASVDSRPRLALSAYFYAHMPLLLGIVFMAAGVAAEVKASDPLASAVRATAATDYGRAGWPAALALGVGAAAFIAGTVAFRAALQAGQLRLRLATAVFALATIALGAEVAIEAQLALLTAGLAVMLAAERLGHASSGTDAPAEGAGNTPVPGSAGADGTAGE